MARLTQAALERLRDLVLADRAGLPAGIAPSEFLDTLIERQLRRYPPLLDLEGDQDDGPAEVELEALAGGADDAVAFVREELVRAAASPYFTLVQQVAVAGDDQAIEQLMALLDRHLKLKGILYRHGMTPELEYPALWGKVWESIPKWDGRDFRAYVARIVRNHCLDDIARKKRSPGTIEGVEHRDPRPPGQTSRVASARDAMSFVLSVLEELEASGRIKAIDGVMFTLVSQGRSVADIVAGFRSSQVPKRLQRAVAALGRRTTASDAIALRGLVEGLTPEELSVVTGRPLDELTRLSEALGLAEELDEEERLLARALCREGMAETDLERAQRLTTNAINLCLNRIRLKMWMALIDRAYENLRRRKAVTADELELVQHRCEHSPTAGCRMYKDTTCSRQRDPGDIARKGGLDLDPDGVLRAMTELRRKVIEEGLGMVFPDYNACLTERKPLRR